MARDGAAAARRPAVVRVPAGAEGAAWARALGCAAPVVLVCPPGLFGEPLAPARAQLGFGAATARHLTLLAMDQAGRALAGAVPGARPAPTAAAIGRALAAGAPAVWLPATMAAARPGPDDPDSLAAWLAARIGADRLVLVGAGGGDGPPSGSGIDVWRPAIATAAATAAALASR